MWPSSPSATPTAPFWPAARPVGGTLPRGFDAKRWRRVEAAARFRVQAVAAAFPVVIADAEPWGAAHGVGRVVSEVVLGLDSTSIIDTAVADRDLLSTVKKRARPSGDDRVHVLVIGDSTSYPVARELDAQGGGRLDVLWAGRDNCPLAPGYEDRWSSTVINRTDDCPSVDNVWPTVLDSFKPSVVVAVDSLPELTEQRYDAHDTWHKPGDGEWETQHRPVADAISALLAPYGARL